MPGTAVPVPVPTPLDEVKGVIAQFAQTTAARIDQMDGKVAEALETARRLGTPSVTVEQLAALHARLDRQEAAAQGTLRQGPSGSDLIRCFEKSDYLKRVREQGVSVLSPQSKGLEIPSLLKRIAITTTALAGAAETWRPQPVEYAQQITSLVDLLVQPPPIADRIYNFIREKQISGSGGVVAAVVAPAIVGGAGATFGLTAVTGCIGMINGSIVVIERTDGAGTLLGYETLTVQSFVLATGVVTCTTNVLGDVAVGDKVSFLSYSATAEGGTKPYTYLSTEPASVTLQTMAILANLSKQSMDDNVLLEAWIQRRMRATHRRNIARQCLYGTGTAPQIHGLFTATGLVTHLWSGDDVGDTIADCVLNAVNDMPDTNNATVCMHKDNWRQLVKEKGVDGHYINNATAPLVVIDRPGLRSVGPHPVYLESELTAGDFLVCDFAQAAELVTKGVAQMLFGYNGNDFSQNMITARYEEDIELAILSVQWYVRGQLDARP